MTMKKRYIKPVTTISSIELSTIIAASDITSFEKIDDSIVDVEYEGNSGYTAADPDYDVLSKGLDDMDVIW